MAKFPSHFSPWTYLLKVCKTLFFGLWATLPLAGSAAPCGDNFTDQIQLPPGFKIEYYAREVPGARSLALGAKGTVFVGTQDEGKVYALVDKNGDQRSDQTLTLLSGLKTPNGVAFKDGDLYVAEINRILRLPLAERNLNRPRGLQVVKGDYPTATHHGWKFIAFGPDGKLYVPVGAPCNICEMENDIYASITRFDVKNRSPGTEIFAKGIRNTVGFDWHPVTGELWFTENGRDWLGDNLPPDELNHAPSKGMHFGYPYCHGQDISDPQFGHRRSCSEFTPPKGLLGPHVAALGMRFYTGGMFPSEYRHQIFIAEHGSWNRSEKLGYRITLATLRGQEVQETTTFAQGWLRQDGKVCGRPVDVLVMPDGALLVSDDYAGAVYRISYEGRR